MQGMRRSFAWVRVVGMLGMLGVVTMLGTGICASGLAVAGCSSDATDTGSSGGGNGEGGGGGDGGGGGNGDGTGGGKDAGDAGADAAASVVNACKTFVDRSAAGGSRTLTWDFAVATAPERCMTVKKGQDVTFSGDFVMHPLVASGGDKPNPISAPDATGKVTFPNAGTFGFVCGNHPAMTGAIRVVE
jgi:plastocyanin